MIIENKMVTDITTNIKHFLNEVELSNMLDLKTAGEVLALRYRLMEHLNALSGAVNAVQMAIDPDPRSQIMRDTKFVNRPNLNFRGNSDWQSNV